jgi:hypothetical protein
MRRALLVLVLLLATLGNSRAAALSLSVSPDVSFEPARLSIVVRLTEHVDNRWLVVALDGPAYYRRSDLELHGAETPRMLQLFWSGVPAGEYVLLAAVFSARRERGRAMRRVMVLGSE